MFLLCIFFILYFSTLKQIYSNSIEGKKNLEQAVSLIKSQNFFSIIKASSKDALVGESQSFSEVIIFSQKAEKNFNSCFNNLQDLKNSFFISHISFLESQCNDFQNLIKTAEILSKAIQQGAVIGEKVETEAKDKDRGWTSKIPEVQPLSLASISIFSNKILKLIYESGPELNGVKANLNLALLNLEKIKNKGLLKLLYKKIEQLKIQLSYGDELISKIIPITKIVSALAGYPEQANYLVLFQNSDELRPTGGFLGSYGILKTKNGNIVEFNTDDVYNLDRFAENFLSIVPPNPFKEYMGADRWFMRDANWSPDWPTSAKKIDWFYKQEMKIKQALLDNKPNEAFVIPQGKHLTEQVDFPKETLSSKEKFNGIIAITPQFVIDLIGIIGPVAINNEKYNQNNFTELLQYKVEKEYVELGILKKQRKEIIGVILQGLMIKLFDLPSERWPEIINVINKNILEKNILVFFNNPVLQNLSENMGMGGEVKKTDNDYLMVVDANLKALKTDAVMVKNISYNFEQKTDGLFAELKINYKHNGENSWKISKYKSWTRIYVPFGSELLSAKVNDKEALVEIQTEADKTCFGVFISIEPGNSGSLYFKYKLPDTLNQFIKNGNYNLYIQKQPGNNIKELMINLNFIKPIQSYYPTDFYVEKIGEKNIKWKSDLIVDKKFKIVL